MKSQLASHLDLIGSITWILVIFPLYNSADISRIAVNRVFYLKLQALLDVIVKKKLFGAVKAYVYRIEWQVRL